MTKDIDKDKDEHAQVGDAHDVHEDHDAHDDHDAHSGHGHGADNSDASTLVPTKFSQLLLPLAIVLLVGLLVAGPIMSAFSSKPAGGTITSEEHSTQMTTGGESDSLHSGPPDTTPTLQPKPTEIEATPTAHSLNPMLIATQTAVALIGEQGDVARIPIRLEFAGVSYKVQQGSGLLPDWNQTEDMATATWIAGTFANHILYVPYDENNAALFTGSAQGDVLKLEMNTGQVFEFQVNLVQRALNGPATQEGQFTVSAAMSQDHAGVTLFLTGDPAVDRAVVQADFTGNIQ